MKCADCDGEAGDNRACTFCGAPLCWSHVTRISLAVHKDNICREVPFYLCRGCVVDMPKLMLCLISKYEETGYKVYKEIQDILENDDE